MIRTIIVDDEPHALEDLEEKIRRDTEFDIVGKCANAWEAIEAIKNKCPDVVFLDIRMPRITGLDMIPMLDKDNMPRIVFVTGYDEYAIEAFKVNAIDYLLKPVIIDRLNISLERLKENHKPQDNVTEAFLADLKFVPCYQGSQNFLIDIKDIIYVFSSPTTGINFITADGQEFHTSLTLKVLEDSSRLLRCHRQHMVNRDHIKCIEKRDNGLGEIHTVGGRIIPVSRRYMDNFPAIA